MLQSTFFFYFNHIKRKGTTWFWLITYSIVFLFCFFVSSHVSRLNVINTRNMIPTSNSERLNKGSYIINRNITKLK